LHLFFDLEKPVASRETDGTLLPSFIAVALPVMTTFLVVKVILAVLCCFGLDIHRLDEELLIEHVVEGVVAVVHDRIGVFAEYSFPTQRTHVVKATECPLFLRFVLNFEAGHGQVLHFHLRRYHHAQHHGILLGRCVIHGPVLGDSEKEGIRILDFGVFAKLVIITVVAVLGHPFQSHFHLIIFQIDFL